MIICNYCVKIMNTYQRYQRVWNILQVCLTPFVKNKFNLNLEQVHCDQPFLIVANHTNTWDPLFVGSAVKNHQVYYVASEHIFRMGFISKVIEWLVGPIPRKKGASGKDTSEACLKHFHEGHSICMFAEGEQSWDGLSSTVIRGTGQLVKDSGVALVTYRIIGGYLSLPRWADKIRKGKIMGEVAGIYPPEELEKMSAEEINELMNRDLFVDAWQRQKENPIPYRSQKRAEYLERMLYVCPKCQGISTLSTKGNDILCECGLNLEIDEYGFIQPGTYFQTLAEWETYQKSFLRNRIEKETEGLLFKEENTELVRIANNHEMVKIDEGALEQYPHHIQCGKEIFKLVDISKMAMTRYGVLLFTHQDQYYQVKVQGTPNLRKYLEVWKASKNKS